MAAHDRTSLATVMPAVAIIAFAGCGAPDIARLDVTQMDWDTLHVRLRFENSDLLGKRSPALPDSVSFAVFSASYDTLYAGSDTVMAVPDRRLGDAEAILVEGCGAFGSERIREQQTVFASPKRVWSGIDVDYPTDTDFTRGDYRVRPLVERRVFGQDDWEELPEAPVPPMTAHVRVAGTTEAGMRIPIRPTGGRFDLRSGDGYRDFRFNLRSAFRDSGRAEIVFQIVAGPDGRETPAGAVRIALVDRSEEELLAALQLLVRDAGNRIVTRLRDVLGGGRAYVFIDAWTYDSAERRYEAELVFWSRAPGRDGWQELSGRLVVFDGGEGAVFRFRDASDGVERAWMERVRADSLSLGTLQADHSDRYRGW